MIQRFLAAILRCLNYRLFFYIFFVGSPRAPWDLTYSEVTENSVRLDWKSGFDMGSRQHFVIYRVFNDVAHKVRLDSWYGRKNKIMKMNNRLT